jgi:hypothetical protein
MVTTTYPDGEPGVAILSWCRFADTTIRGAEIAKDLTTATKAEDLADAFAWFEDVFSAEAAQEVLQHIRNGASLVHGDTTMQTRHLTNLALSIWKSLT